MHINIGQYPRLSREDEKTATVEQLVTCNLALVISIARRYVNYTSDAADLLDIVQDGNLGLIKAAHDYDASRGLFANCATYHIRNSIRNSMFKNRTLKLPRDAVRDIKHIMRRHNTGETYDQIASALKLCVEAVRAVIEDRGAIVDDCNTSAQSSDDDPALIYIKYETFKKLERILTESEYNTILSRCQGYTLQELAEQRGTSTQSVSIQQQKAITKLIKNRKTK